jgi:hypothetical protein
VRFSVFSNMWITESYRTYKMITLTF